MSYSLVMLPVALLRYKGQAHAVMINKSMAAIFLFVPGSADKKQACNTSLANSTAIGD